MSGRRTIEALGSAQASLFLSAWIVNLCISARTPEVVPPKGVGLNEVVLVLATQLASRLDGGPIAYPNEALLQVVREKAEFYGCAPEVNWAAAEALRRVGPPS